MRAYFAYGSNMSQARLEQRVGALDVLGLARLPGHRHRFSKLGLDRTGKGNIEANHAESVWGVVYELDDAQLARLAEIEVGYGAVTLEVAALTTGSSLRVMSFEAHAIVPNLQPSAAYIEHYLVGMREHGVPRDYRARLLSEYQGLVPDR